MEDDAVQEFWVRARRHAGIGTLPGYLGPGTLEALAPLSWSSGADPEQADRLLQLVLDGTRTATASPREDYDLDGVPLPEAGDMGIVLDGRGRPRALVTVTSVEVKPFDEVTEADAHDEGEGSRTLAQWRTDHEEGLTRHDPHGRGSSSATCPWWSSASGCSTPSEPGRGGRPGSARAACGQTAYEPVRNSSTSEGREGVQPRLSA